jgi:hypothetical protein
MRIALICEAFRSIGGIQEVVDNLAGQMLAAGHAVAIFATPYVTPNAERVRRPPPITFTSTSRLASRSPGAIPNALSAIRKPGRSSKASSDGVPMS